MVPDDLADQIAWLMENSQGVAGLRLDDGVLIWAEVVSRYLPAWPRARLVDQDAEPERDQGQQIPAQDDSDLEGERHRGDPDATTQQGRSANRLDQIVQFVAAFAAREGYAPSYRTIAKGVGLRAASTIHRYVQILERQGRLRRLPKNRGVVVVGPR